MCSDGWLVVPSVPAVLVHLVSHVELVIDRPQRSALIKIPSEQTTGERSSLLPRIGEFSHERPVTFSNSGNQRSDNRAAPMPV